MKQFLSLAFIAGLIVFNPLVGHAASPSTTDTPAAAADTGTDGPKCKTGKPCGNTCIAKDKVCHKDAKPKNCKKGKPCGNTCISKDKECHVQ